MSRPVPSPPRRLAIEWNHGAGWELGVYRTGVLDGFGSAVGVVTVLVG